MSALVCTVAETLGGTGAQIRGVASVLVALALLSAGCARISAPQVEEIPGQELSTAQMLEIMERSYAHVSLQALAEVRLRRGDDKQRSTQALHVQAPYQLRAEVYNFMGQMLVMLTANGADLEAYVPSRNTLYRGMATRGRMERFAYVPLMPADMVALLLQRLPPGVLQLSQVQKGGRNILRFIVSAQQEYIVQFDAERVQRIMYLELGQEVFSIAYAATPTVEGETIFPHHMSLAMPLQDLELDIELEDVQLNPTLEPDLFEIEERTGVDTVPLEEL
jgi:outer membrane lipoprotein-sorting protein